MNHTALTYGNNQWTGNVDKGMRNTTWRNLQCFKNLLRYKRNNFYHCKFCTWHFKKGCFVFEVPKLTFIFRLHVWCSLLLLSIHNSMISISVSHLINVKWDFPCKSLLSVYCLRFCLGSLLFSICHIFYGYICIPWNIWENSTPFPNMLSLRTDIEVGHKSQALRLN